MRKKIKKTIRYFLYLLAGLVVTLAVFSSIARFIVTPWISHYGGPLENYVSKQLKVPVKIGQLKAGWHYFTPVIHLSNVKIFNADDHLVVAIHDLEVGINVFSSLYHWNVQPGALFLSHIDIILKPTLFSGTGNFSWNALFHWFLERKKILLNDINIEWSGPIDAEAPKENQSVILATPFSKKYFDKDLLLRQPSFKISEGSFMLTQGFGGNHHLQIQFDWLENATSVVKPTHFFTAINFSEENDKINKKDFLFLSENFNFSAWKKRALPFLSESQQSSLSNIQIQDDENHIQWWGTFKGDHLIQNADINTKNLQINYPVFFKYPLLFSDLNTSLKWEKLSEHWYLSIERLFLENPNMSVNTQGSISWEKGIEDTFTQINAQFALQDLKEIKAYLPDNKMNKKLSLWLHRSITDGNRTNGTLILKGYLKEFPFDKTPEEKGLFLVDTYWDDFSLDYKENWPAAKNINAHIIFKNRDLIADIYGGTIDKLPLTDIKATILGLGLPENFLNIQGHLQTDVGNARHFVLNSPLKKYLNSFEKMDITGPAVFDIGIQIPLYKGNDDNLVNGKIIFLKDEFILKNWWNLHFQDFNGWLTYNQTGVVDSRLKALMYHYPLNLRIKTDLKPQKATAVDISGKIGIDALQNIFHLKIFDFMKGATTYQAHLLLTASTKDQDTLALSSNLKGVAIDLPKPYGKPSKTALPKNAPLALLLEFSELHETCLDINYANQVDLYLTYEKSKNNYYFKRGGIHLGGNNAKALSPSNGFKIKGVLPEFSFSAWEPFITKMSESDGHNPLSDTMESLEISTPLADLKGEILHHADIKLSKKDSLWIADVLSDELSGNIKVNTPLSKGISADLNHITLNSTTKKTSMLKPSDIPPLNIHAKSVYYQKTNLGEVTLLTTTQNNQWSIKTLTFKLPNSTLNIQGSWVTKANKLKSNISKANPSQTKIKGSLVSSNIQKTLTELGIEPVIEGQKGLLNFNLNWTGSPENFSVEHLNGNSHLQIDHGVITHLNKSMEHKVGLGKLLNFFNLQNLPRRLKLDFSDLSAKGLSFDIAKGDFSIKNGNINTTDLYLDGPIAYIDAKGSINLVKKVYDLVVSISPHAGTSLPAIVATIAAGPIVGLAALAADTLITQGVKKKSLYNYTIKGPWASPQFEST